MADRIRQYLAYVNGLLEQEDADVDWEEEMKKHLVQIAFFAHERFIHLIVTVTFAILAAIIVFHADGVDGAIYQALFLIGEQCAGYV